VTEPLSIVVAAPAITVSISPSTQTTIDQAQTLNFTATLTNDSSNAGVTWSVAGTACSGTACGTFTNSTTSAATYNAPAAVSSNTTMTVTAPPLQTRQSRCLLQSLLPRLRASRRQRWPMEPWAQLIAPPCRRAAVRAR
jgi:hypothetical protein